MAKFGWAYINCSGSADGSATGPTNSVQWYIGSGNSSGSLRYTFVNSTNTLHLTGALNVSGAISASSYHIKNVVNIDVSGSTYFGNTNDDVHVRTGSLGVFRVDGVHGPILYANQAKLTTEVHGLATYYRRITSATYTVVLGDNIIGCSGSSGGSPISQTITLLPASDVLVGTQLLIKDEYKDRGATKIFVSSSGGNKIENRAFTVMVGTMPAINLYTDGSNWFIY
jgi:hypothetical protein